MRRAAPLLGLASLAVAAACSDRPASTAPPRSSLLASTSPADAPYEVIVGDPEVLLGFPGSNLTATVAVTGVGDVAGFSLLDGQQRVVRWPPGSAVPIDVAAGSPRDINTAGQLAGEAAGHAALWTPDGAGGYTLTHLHKQLPSPVLSTAYGINGSGQVVGTYRESASDGTWADRCFLWTPDAPNAPTGTVATLPGLGGSFCVASDVNSAGYVVGAATLADGETRGFVWIPPRNGRLGKIRDLTPAGGPSYATSINDVGQVAGQHTTSSASNAVVWTPTASGSYLMTNLGTFTGSEAWALDINDAGFVVGFARRNDPLEDDAFLWQNGKFTLLPGTGSITNASALTALNGSSVQVVGTSHDPAGNTWTAIRWNVTVASSSPSPK